MIVDYNRLADRFDERYQHLTYPVIRGRLRRLIDRPGIDVLEVGCGTGHWLGVLSDLDAHLFGIDPSLAMLDKAQSQAPEAVLACASAERLPFRSNSLGLVFCVNAFHHFSDPERFLQDSRALLRRGGRLAIFGLDPHVPGVTWYFYDYFPGLKKIDLQRFLPHKKIGHLMAEVGFQNIATEPADRIQATYVGEEVLKDPFLDRTSTSQLQLISEEAYAQGKRAIISRIKSSNETNRRVSFNVDHHLFATIGTRDD